MKLNYDKYKLEKIIVEIIKITMTASSLYGLMMLSYGVGKDDNSSIHSGYHIFLVSCVLLVIIDFLSYIVRRITDIKNRTNLLQDYSILITQDYYIRHEIPIKYPIDFTVGKINKSKELYPKLSTIVTSNIGPKLKIVLNKNGNIKAELIKELNLERENA